MASRNSDVQLVIRAKDEAKSTVDNVRSSLENLLASFRKGEGNAASFAKGFAAIDAAFAGLAGKATSAEQAFDRVNKAISAKRTDLQSTTAQLLAATEALAKFNAQSRSAGGKSDSFIGPLNFGPQITAAKAAIADLNKLIGTQTREIAKMEAGIQGGASSLQLLGSSATAVEQKISAARAEVERETLALQRMAAAAETASRVGDITGVSRGSALDNGAGFEALARREIALQKQRAEAARDAASALQASISRSTGTGRGAAVDNGASFSALEGRERENSLREAAHAHLLFETRVREGAKALAQEQRAVDELADYIQDLREQLDPAARAQRYLNEQTAKLNLARNKISAEEYAHALQLINQSADQMRKKPQISLFGLKPYERQNLLFQFNDIATQLASGTSLTQTLAQQGGQILQLFPRVGAAIATGLTSAPVLAFVSTLGVLILALKRASDNAQTLREIRASLTLAADGAKYQATEIQGAAKALDIYGLSAEDALKVVKVFMADGFDAAAIQKFGKAAKDMSVVLGTDVVDSAKQLDAAFSGGYENVTKLDQATRAAGEAGGLYTASQLRQIKVLFDAGQAEKARALAAEIAIKKYDEAADKARGPWSEAARNFGNAWDSAINLFANSGPIQAFAGYVNEVAVGIGKLTDNLGKLDSAWDVLGELSAFYNMGAASYGRNAPTLGNPGSRDGEIGANGVPFVDASRVQGARPPAVRITEDQQKANDALKRASEERLGLEEQITSQAAVQAKLAEVRKKALEEANTAEAFRGATDAAKQQFAAAAVERERVKLNKQLADYQDAQVAKAKAAREAEETALKAFVARVVKAENSTGDPAARNPRSTATGNGQFIESTWLNLFRKYFPAQAENMGRDAILALRKDAETSAKMIELYARENARALQQSGNAVTEANLQLAHFLGPKGAIKVLGASADTPIAKLLSGDAIRANPEILGGNATAGSVRAYALRRAGGAGAIAQTEMEGASRLAEIEQDRLNVQTAFDEKVADENEKRKLGIASLESQKGLIGEALVQEQRRQAVAEAVLQKQQEIDKLNATRAAKGLPGVAFTAEQRSEIEKTTGAYFDLAHARDIAEARRMTAQQPVDDLLALRDALQQQIKFFQETGKTETANGLQKQLDTVNAKLELAVEKLQEFYRTLTPDDKNTLGLTAEQLDAIQLKLDTITATTERWNYYLGISGQTIAQSIAGNGSNAFSQFAQAIAQGRNAFASLRDAFLSFASTFLQQIAQMIAQQQIFNLVSGLFKAGTTVIGAGQGGPLDAGQIFHDGGVVGSTAAPTRLVNPAWFNNARRYHGGGIAGLAPGEVPAVLMTGEEVLTADDPRHIKNGGGAASVKVVNAFDAADMLSKGLDTREGEQAILNFVKNNPGAFRAAMG